MAKFKRQQFTAQSRAATSQKVIQKVRRQKKYLKSHLLQLFHQTQNRLPQPLPPSSAPSQNDRNWRPTTSRWREQPRYDIL